MTPKMHCRKSVTVVFMIHGVGGSSDVWQAQLDCFNNCGIEVVAPDLIGHGFSSAPRDRSAYEFTEIAQDMVAVFDRYCKQCNVVVGHSYGTSFAAFVTVEGKEADPGEWRKPDTVSSSTKYLHGSHLHAGLLQAGHEKEFQKECLPCKKA